MYAEKIKKILLFLLILLPLYLLISLYYLDKTYFLCPIEYAGDMVIRFDSRGEGLFGSARRGNRLHQGLDLFAQIGTPVLATRSGKISSVNTTKGMGNYIVIRHPDNITSIYGHLLKIYVQENTLVRQGEVIGEVGKTGNANYPNILPHLHFEIRKDAIPQDPIDYLE